MAKKPGLAGLLETKRTIVTGLGSRIGARALLPLPQMISSSERPPFNPSSAPPIISKSAR